MGKACGTPNSRISHNRKFSKQVSVQASRSSNNFLLKVALVLQQIITELSESVPEEDKKLSLQKWYLMK
jgi:hypothetical protein